MISWIGHLFYSAYTLVLVVLFDEVGSDWLLVRGVTGCFGLTSAFYMGVYSYISDISSGVDDATKVLLPLFEQNFFPSEESDS